MCVPQVSTLKRIVNDPVAARILIARGAEALAAEEAAALTAAAFAGGAEPGGGGNPFAAVSSGGALGSGGAAGKKAAAAALDALEPAKRVITDPAAEVALSGKLHVLLQLLLEVKRTTPERFVLISNFTTTLDLFEAVLRHGAAHAEAQTARRLPCARRHRSDRAAPCAMRRCSRPTG